MTAGFRLLAPPVLSRNAVNRDEQLRFDVARQRAGWRRAQVVVVDQVGRTPVDWKDGEARLRMRPAVDLAPTPPPDAVLLGEADGVGYWAMRGEPEPLIGGETGWADPAERDWADLRAVGAELDALGAGLLTAAVAALGWHDAARFCPRDGSPTHPHNAGWARRCEAAQHEEYPRTDPAVICLVHDSGDRVLLARQPVWPPGRYSVLAGFVEAGESLEACVAREVHEEVGVRVREIGYLGSQAWPFPRSLMVGFQALADPNVALRPAEGEIAEAMWVTRDELRRALARGDWSGRGEPDQVLRLPGKVSIARSMLEAWAARG